MRASTSDIVAAILEVRTWLQRLGLLLDFNESVIEKTSNSTKRITWAVNGVRPDLSNYKDSSIEEYVFFLKGKHYQAQLIDGSIIQISYDIKRNNDITGARLVWYPCPTDFELQELETATIEEIVLTTPTHKLGCRAPIRIDFAPHLKSENHSSTHMHLGYEKTRLPVQRAMEPLRFLSFILRTAYPDYWLQISNNFQTGNWSAKDERDNNDILHASICWNPVIA
jgi:hypothetical protein